MKLTNSLCPRQTSTLYGEAELGRRLAPARVTIARKHGSVLPMASMPGRARRLTWPWSKSAAGSCSRMRRCSPSSFCLTPLMTRTAVVWAVIQNSQSHEQCKSLVPRKPDFRAPAWSFVPVESKDMACRIVGLNVAPKCAVRIEKPFDPGPHMRRSAVLIARQHGCDRLVHLIALVLRT